MKEKDNIIFYNSAEISEKFFHNRVKQEEIIDYFEAGKIDGKKIDNEWHADEKTIEDFIHNVYLKEKSYDAGLHKVDLSQVILKGRILDIGGGGEGIIAQIKGESVVAIDPNKEELQFYLSTILLSTLIGTIVFGYVGDNLFKKGRKNARVLLALIGNIVPIPLLFVALIIPFQAPNNVSTGELFVIPEAIIMLILMMIGMFANGAVNGNWYATIVDLNLPEHRGTTLATANFFDVIGRSLGPLIGSFVRDAFGSVYGMMMSIVAWILIPFFWIPVLKNVITEMNATEKIFSERIKELEKA